MPERTLTYLEQLMSDVFRAIETGNAYALSQFEKDKETISPSRLFDTMRYKTVLALKEKGYDLKELSMYGIHIMHKGYDIKVLKVQSNGSPPICGKSKNRWAFFNHHRETTLPGIDKFEEIIKEFQIEERRELLVLYKVGSDGNFLGLELTCTEQPKLNFAPLPLAWQIPIPHPAKSETASNKYEETTKDIETFDDQEDAGDVDIFKDGTEG